mgnify:CR=1 FL=1
MLRVLKNNKLAVLVISAYVLAGAYNYDVFWRAIDNSRYYLVEMAMIMPVIFLLTIALEVLVPKEAIVKHFGEGSGLWGNMLALILGSISAGPIYAAFPIGQALYKKGSSIANIAIIISAWAVIKIPMLANEARFLGVDFMIARWLLTVMAILGIAYIMAWKLKPSFNRSMHEIYNHKDGLADLVNKPSTVPLALRTEYCIGCGICAKMLPTHFAIVDRKVTYNTFSVTLWMSYIENGQLEQVLKACPTNVISLVMGDETV